MLGQVEEVALLLLLLLLVQVVAVPQLTAREGRVVRRLVVVRGGCWSSVVPVVCTAKTKGDQKKVFIFWNEPPSPPNNYSLQREGPFMKLK